MWRSVWMERLEGALSPHRRFLTSSFTWLKAGIWFLIRLLLITWATLAIYYSNLPCAAARLVLAIGFAAFAIWGMSASASQLHSCVGAVSWRARVVDIHRPLA